MLSSALDSINMQFFCFPSCRTLQLEAPCIFWYEYLCTMYISFSCSQICRFHLNAHSSSIYCLERYFIFLVILIEYAFLCSFLFALKTKKPFIIPKWKINKLCILNQQIKEKCFERKTTEIPKNNRNFSQLFLLVSTVFFFILCFFLSEKMDR